MDSQHHGRSQRGSPGKGIKVKKKKKRSQEGEATVVASPSLTSLVEPEELKVKVEVVYDRADRSLPIVGYFPSGYKPSDLESVQLYRNAHKGKIEEKRRGHDKIEIVVKPSGRSNVEFVGSSYKGEAASVQLCTYALGILDKENGTLKIVPIAGNKILRLEPKVKVASVSETSERMNKDVQNQKREDKLRELTRTYGTKKSQNQDMKRKALNRGTNPEALADLGRTIEDAPVNKEALVGTSAHVSQNIPPHNPSATLPKDAYPLDKIIFAGEWDFLEDIYQKFDDGGDIGESSYPLFVCNRIHNLKDVRDKMEQKTQACVFSYITHLVKFKDMHSLDGIGAAKKHRIPNILQQKFMAMFNPASEKWLPSEKLFLLTSYVLVLTLHLDNFRTKLDDISKDLRMSMLDLRGIFEKLGCKLVRSEKSLVATLPMPLTFPQVILRKRKRGR